MLTRRWFGLNLPRWIALLAALVGAVFSLLALAAYVFGGGRLEGVLTRRAAGDALGIGPLLALAGVYLLARPQQATVVPPRARRVHPAVMVALLALILLAAWLRFHKLEFQSLWRDEVASVARVESLTLGGALTLGNWQDAWPSYHIPVYFFVKLAGDSEFAFRFPSALMGVLLVPVLFALGKHFFTQREGLMAAGLAAVLRTPLWYSQEMRSYAFLMVYAVLSGYFWMRLARDVVADRGPRWWLVVGYAISSILTIYAHYFGLLLLAVEGLGSLWLVIRARRLPLALVIAYAAIGLAYLPWLPLLLGDLGKQDFWASRPNSFGGKFYALQLFFFHKPMLYIVGALAAISLGLLLWRIVRRRADGAASPLVIAPAVVLGLWLVAPYALAYYRSQVATPILVDRYLLISLPAAYVLAARGVTRLPLGRIGGIAAGAALVAVMLILLLVGPYYTQPNKTQLREAIQYIAGHESQYPDAVIIGGYQGGKRELDYYFRKFGSPSTIDIKAGNTWQIDDVRAQLAARQPRYIWFMGQYLFYEAEFREYLDHDFTRLAEFHFFHIDLFLYENPARR